MATDTPTTQTAAPRTLTVTVPLLLPLLTPNKRLHWAKRARHAADQRAVAEFCAVADHGSGRGVLTGRVRMDVTVRPLPRMKEHDDDNLWAAMKHYRDGLASAFGADDKQFRQGALTWDKGQRTGELVIVLTEVGA